MQRWSKLIVLVLVIAAVAAVFIFDLQQYLTLDNLKAQQQSFSEYYAANQAQTLAIFFLVYVGVAALSIPGAALLSLLAGALFGAQTGTIVVLLGATVGASLAFLVSRFLFKDAIQEKFGQQLGAINNGIEKEGAFYLFTLRLIPAFPFFVINLVMGLTPIKLFTFAWVSFIGMMPGTFVFVNAGTQLATIESASGILSVPLIASFVALGILPLVAKRVIDLVKQLRVYKGYRKPKKFDRNLVVIGGGSAGLVTALIAAAVKSKVSLIERHRMGGDCLYTGCVPSKALIRSAKFRHDVLRSKALGFASAETNFRFADIMDRVQKIIETIEPHDSPERFTDLGVDCIAGDAVIEDPWRVRVGDRVITTKNIVISTGAAPFVPPIEGIQDVNYLTSDSLWSLREQPKRLVVLGGGPIGCEMAQSFARLGSEVTLIEMLPRIMAVEDEDAGETVAQHLVEDGVRILTGHRASKVSANGDGCIIHCEFDGGSIDVECDQLLVAVGRKPNTQMPGIEELGLEKARNGALIVDEYLRTKYPNIFACGDVIGPYQFTHTASHEAWYCAVNALFGSVKKFKVDYSVVPWATYTDPEVARVGLSEQDAKKQEIEVEVTRYELSGHDRALAEQEAKGFVKVLTVPGKDKILGATVVSAHAGELLAPWVIAMKHGIGLNKILGTIHAYPTMAEANKFAAGNWKKAHAPEGLLGWIEKFHRWRLG